LINQARDCWTDRCGCACICSAWHFR
jgi:hypothetical protein